MPSVIVDISPLHAKSNQTPPKNGNYTFSVGTTELAVNDSTLKNAFNEARALARQKNLFRVALTSATSK